MEALHTAYAAYVPDPVSLFLTVKIQIRIYRTKGRDLKFICIAAN